MKPYRLFADTYEDTPSINFHDYVKAGHVIIALKASEGRSHIDTLHAPRAREAHAAGLSVIHYHFARPDEGNSTHDEVHLFSMVVKPTWRPGDYLWLDFERVPPAGVQDSRPWVESFCALTREALGATPILYASESALNGGLADVRIKGERYAPAKYGGAPTSLARRRMKWSEQYTDGKLGHGPHGAEGIGSCDMNEFHPRIASAVRIRTGWRRWRFLHPGRKG